MRKKIMAIATIAVSLLFFAGSGLAAITVDLPALGSYSGTVDAGSAKIGVGFDGNGALIGAQGSLMVTEDPLRLPNTLLVGNYLPGGGAQGPVALLLNQAATDFTFTVGVINAMMHNAAQNLLVTVFDDMGRSEDFNYSLHALSPTGLNFYQTFTLSSANLSSFRRVLFGPNTDVSGWSYGAMSYNAAPVPVPAAVWLLGSGLAGLALVRRRQ